MDKGLAFGILMYACGLVSGLVFSNFLWCARIREKAVTRFRLEVWGQLYDVRPSDSANAPPKKEVCGRCSSPDHSQWACPLYVD